MLVLGGTFGVAMASGLMKDATGAGGLIAKALKAKPEPPDETIAQMVDFAERARREGLLALEEVTKTVDDPFLKKGIELAVDGTDPEELREILENEIASYRTEQKAGAKFFENMGGFAGFVAETPNALRR